jgi:hypothetical protein
MWLLYAGMLLMCFVSVTDEDYGVFHAIIDLVPTFEPVY